MTWRPVQSGGRVFYSFKKGSPVPNNKAQEVGEYLESIAGDTGVTPPSLVQDAQNEESLMHQFFEWDNESCGDKWRLHTARKILNHLEMKVVNVKTEETGKARVFVNVRIKQEKPVKPARESESVPLVDGPTQESKPLPVRVYMPIVKAFAEKDYKQQVIRNAKMELKRWRDRYKMYNEFSEVFLVIDRLAVDLSTD